MLYGKLPKTDKVSFSNFLSSIFKISLLIIFIFGPNLLSRCDGLVYVTSNISSAAIAWNLNNAQKRFKIDNGINSKNIILSRFLWYVKKIIPKSIGGFNKNL